MQKLLFKLLFWVVVPFMVFYGYYFNNESFANIVVFITWIGFIVYGIFILILILIVVYFSIIEKDKIQLNKIDNIDSIERTQKKINSKLFKFNSWLLNIIYFLLSILIASTGNIFLAIIFFITFVVDKLLMIMIVKKIFEDIISLVEKNKDNNE